MALHVRRITCLVLSASYPAYIDEFTRLSLSFPPSGGFHTNFSLIRYLAALCFFMIVGCPVLYSQPAIPHILMIMLRLSLPYDAALLFSSLRIFAILTPPSSLLSSFNVVFKIVVNIIFYVVYKGTVIAIPSVLSYPLGSNALNELHCCCRCLH